MHFHLFVSHLVRLTSSHISLSHSHLPRHNAAPLAALLAVFVTTATPTILLVEDNGTLRRVLKLWLKGEDYTVLSASTGAEAREHAAQEGVQIDLLLTDVGLPDTDGVTLAGELMPAGNIGKLLYMSAIPLSKHRAEGRDIDRELFLAKPFARQEFIDRIAAELEE